MKAFVTNILVTLLSLLVCFLLLEGTFRLLPKPQQVAEDRPKVWYFPQNSDGSSNEYYAQKKPENTFRIAVAGDSFRYAGKVQFGDGYAERLEHLLNLNSDSPKVEVLNLGHPGAATLHELRDVRKALPTFDPDLVLLQITLNDPRIETYRPTFWFQDNHGNVNLSQAVLIKHSKFLTWVTTRICNYIAHQDYIRYHHDIYNNNKEWPIFKQSLRAIRNLVAANKKKSTGSNFSSV